MLDDMRYTIVFLVLITLGCSKQSSPSEAATETKGDTESSVSADPAPKAAPDKVDLPPVQPPTVTLISAGKPPLRKVRWEFREGAKEVLNTTINQTGSMRGGGWDSESVPIGIAQTIDFTTSSVSPDGSAEVALLIREVTEVQTPDADSAAVIGGEGAKGTYTVSSTGVIRNLTLVPSPDAKYKELGVIQSLLRLTLLPVPEEPIGAGAKWTVTQDVNQFGSPAKEVMTAELVELGDSDLVVSVGIQSKGGRAAAHGKTVSIATDTQILTKVSPNKLVPLSSELENQVVETVKAAGVDGPMGQLTVRTHRKVKMESE